MFKVGDRVKITIPKMYAKDWSFIVIHGSRQIGNDDLLCSLKDIKTGKYFVDTYDKYVIYDEKYYRRLKLEKICSKMVKC